MPDWGVDPETCRLARWLKAEGDPVVQGEPLVEVETGKVTVEVESPASGTLASISAAEGDDVALGQSLALIVAEGEAIPKVPRVSAAPRPVPSATAGEQAPVGHVWRVMAERLSRSWAEVPHFYLVRDVNTSALRARRQERRRSGGGVPSVSDVLVRASAAALVEHPRMNASWTDGAVTLHPSVNIGFQGTFGPLRLSNRCWRLRLRLARRCRLIFLRFSFARPRLFSKCLRFTRIPPCDMGCP